MTERPRFLFDENFGRPAVDRLVEFLRIDPDDEASPVIRHVLDFQEEGILDDEWIPKMARERWILITADRGKKPSKGSKLPRLCAEFGVTHVLMSGKIHQRSLQNKIHTILHVWGDLIQLHQEPLGSRFMLVAISNKPEDNTKARLKQKKTGYPPVDPDQLFDPDNP